MPHFAFCLLYSPWDRIILWLSHLIISVVLCYPEMEVAGAKRSWRNLLAELGVERKYNHPFLSCVVVRIVLG